MFLLPYTIIHDCDMMMFHNKDIIPNKVGNLRLLMQIWILDSNIIP